MRHGELRIPPPLFDNYLGYSICVNNSTMELFVGIDVSNLSVSMFFFVLKNGCNGNWHSNFVANNIMLLCELKVEE
jgi:hypothetical protein